MALGTPHGRGDQLLLNWSHPRTISVGDADVSVHLGGRGQPVLIVPGFPESPRSYLPLAEALAVDHQVILPYLPGTGPSFYPATGGCSIVRNAQRMWKLCETLGARNIQVIGHDLGGGIAYWLALHHMQNVRRMVILSTPLRGLSVRLVGQAMRLAFPGISDLMFSVAGPAIVRRTYQQRVGPGFTIPLEELERSVDTWAPAKQRRAAIPYHRSFRNLLVMREFRDAWVNVPTLLLFGDSVKGIPRKSMQLTAEALARGKVKVIRGVGHFPHLERPQEVAQIVRDYLAVGRAAEKGVDSIGRPPI